MDKRKIVLILLGIGLYLLSTGVSYALFSQFSPGQKTISLPAPTKTATGDLTFDTSLPKTEPCLLNGELYSKQQKAWWEKHSPLGVMIENHQDSRPQSGLYAADVIYEAVAEGGITRFLAVYHCQDATPIGPVRSARTYFLDFISEYGDYPLYAHVGGANADGPADALSQIEDYGWGAYNDLSQFSIGFPTFWRDANRLGRSVATEHTMYSTTTKLWDFAKTRKLTNVNEDGVSWDDSFIPYTFKDDMKLSQRPENQKIKLEFWEGNDQYLVDWMYNKSENNYLRNHDGKAHVDKNTNKALTAKNIVVLFMTERHANDGYEGNVHLVYKTTGSGKAIVFMNGEEIKASWRKDKRTSRTLIFDSKGSPITFNRGRLWFEILPTTGEVTVK